MKIYQVGGSVRDELLGLPQKDIDWVVTGSNPQQMHEQGFLPVGKDFPVFLHPKTKQEYALARSERKVSAGYGGFEFQTASSITLEQDLLRRDLTINAIAKDEDGHLIDPYGGCEDIENRVLRHVSPAFAEDPVRVLRIARFAARFHNLGFRIANETIELIKPMRSSGELDALVAERVWTELSRALNEKNPSAFFYALKSCEVLDILFPEINSLFGVPQTAKYHPEVDTGLHVMLAIDKSAELGYDLLTRFAVMTHDFGKGLTPDHILPSHHGHEIAGLEPIRIFCQRWKVPKHYRELALATAEYHTHVHRAFTLKSNTLLNFMTKAGALRQADQFDRFLNACIADIRGRTGFEDAEYPQAAFLKTLAKYLRESSVQTVVESGKTGEELGEAIRQYRIKLIGDFDRSGFKTG